MTAKHPLFILVAVLSIVWAVGAPMPQTSTAAPLAPKIECPVVSPPIEIWRDALENGSPSVAFNPRHGEFLVAWHTMQQGLLTQEIWAARVALDGQVPSWFNVVTEEAELRYDPAVAYSPVQDQYFIAYTQRPPGSNDSEIYHTLVDWNGSTIEAERRVRPDANVKERPSVAYNEADDEYLVVYENYAQFGYANIAAQTLRANHGGQENWRLLSASVPESGHLADVAYGPWLNSYLVVHDQQLATSAIEGHHTWASHDLSQVSSGNSARSLSYDWTHPQVAAGPGEFLYVWQKKMTTGGSEIYARRFDAEGNPLGPAEGFPISGNGTIQQFWLPQVAFAGSGGYLVVWTHVDSSGAGDVLGAFVPAGQGQVAGDPFPIFDSNHDEWASSLACTPWGYCLVAITDRWPQGGAGDRDILGKFVHTCPRVYMPLVLR